MIVSEIMNRVATINSNITLQHAAKIMSREGIGSLVLMRLGKARGIITERDVVKNIDKLNKKVTSIMAKKLITMDQWSELEEAAEVMKNNGIKRVLVRGEKKKIIGIITATDLIANADLLNQDLDLM
jgi:predicted transcriptional regulator